MKRFVGLLHRKHSYFRALVELRDGQYLLRDSGVPMVLINSLRRGDAFGEFALIASVLSGKRSATVFCPVDSHLLVLGRTDFVVAAAHQEILRDSRIKALRDKLDLLAAVPALREVSSGLLKSVLCKSNEVRLRYGQVVYDLGEQVRCIYFILQGAVELQTPTNQPATDSDQTQPDFQHHSTLTQENLGLRNHSPTGKKRARQAPDSITHTEKPPEIYTPQPLHFKTVSVRVEKHSIGEEYFLRKTKAQERVCCSVDGTVLLALKFCELQKLLVDKDKKRFEHNCLRVASHYLQLKKKTSSSRLRSSLEQSAHKSAEQSQAAKTQTRLHHDAGVLQGIRQEIAQITRVCLDLQQKKVEADRTYQKERFAALNAISRSIARRPQAPKPASRVVPGRQGSACSIFQTAGKATSAERFEQEEGSKTAARLRASSISIKSIKLRREVRDSSCTELGRHPAGLQELVQRVRLEFLTDEERGLRSVSMNMLLRVQNRSRQASPKQSKSCEKQSSLLIRRSAVDTRDLNDQPVKPAPRKTLRHKLKTASQEQRQSTGPRGRLFAVQRKVVLASNLVCGLRPQQTRASLGPKPAVLLAAKSRNSSGIKLRTAPVSGQSSFGT